MNSLRHFHLGEPCPNSPHAVVSSLPTMADVHGYEKGEPRVLEALKSGYPRFVVHEFVQALVSFYLERDGLAGNAAVLIPSRRATQGLVDYAGVGVASAKVEGLGSPVLRTEATVGDLFCVYFDGEDRDLNRRVRRFVQHTGCGISSRQAEDLLVAHGLKDAVFAEDGVFAGALQTVESGLAGLVGCRAKDVLVCSSGMNAFYAAFRAVQEAQSAKGRSKWLQVGWLYLDSGCVLKEFLDRDESLGYCYDATDTDAIVAEIERCGSGLACVVIECPTNPLVQVADLKRISDAVRAQGGILMLDPTIASVYNVDVLQYCDLLTTSLTKYAAYQGDVMLGALTLNPNSPHYGDLVLRTSSFYQPPYPRDLARLADQMQSAPQVVEQMDTNARRLADFLRSRPEVKRVHYAGYSEHFSNVAKTPSSAGAMITIELHGNIEPFYDALGVMKGPSFGTNFTLVCPFMYLAHYDLVTAEEGRSFLASIGIDPDLVRISVGAEPYESIEAVFVRALTALGTETK